MPVNDSLSDSSFNGPSLSALKRGLSRFRAQNQDQNNFNGLAPHSREDIDPSSNPSSNALPLGALGDLMSSDVSTNPSSMHQTHNTDRKVFRHPFNPVVGQALYTVNQSVGVGVSLAKKATRVTTQMTLGAFSRVGSAALDATLLAGGVAYQLKGQIGQHMGQVGQSVNQTTSEWVRHAEITSRRTTRQVSRAAGKAAGRAADFTSEKAVGMAGVAGDLTRQATKASIQGLVGVAGIAVKAPLFVASVPLTASRLAMRYAAREALSMHKAIRGTREHINGMAQVAMGWQAGEIRKAPLLARTGISMIIIGQALLEPPDPWEQKSFLLKSAQILSAIAPLLQTAGSMMGWMRPPDSASLGFREMQESLANAAEVSIGSAFSSRGLNLVNLAIRREKAQQERAQAIDSLSKEMDHMEGINASSLMKSMDRHFSERKEQWRAAHQKAHSGDSYFLTQSQEHQDQQITQHSPHPQEKYAHERANASSSTLDTGLDVSSTGSAESTIIKRKAFKR